MSLFLFGFVVSAVCLVTYSLALAAQLWRVRQPSITLVHVAMSRQLDKYEVLCNVQINGLGVQRPSLPAITLK